MNKVFFLYSIPNRSTTFNIIVNSRAIRNYIILKIVKQLGIPYKKKKKPYLLVTISGEPVLYKDSIINLETELIQIDIKG